jgi:hypothetical protein
MSRPRTMASVGGVELAGVLQLEISTVRERMFGTWPWTEEFARSSET